MLRNIKQLVVLNMILAGAVITAGFTSAAQSLKGLKSFAFQVAVGSFAFDGTNYLTFSMEHSDDGASWSACGSECYYENDVLVLNNQAAHENKVHLIQYRGYKPYVRLVCVESGTVSVGLAVNGLAMPEVMQASESIPVSP